MLLFDVGGQSYDDMIRMVMAIKQPPDANSILVILGDADPFPKIMQPHNVNVS